MDPAGEQKSGGGGSTDGWGKCEDPKPRNPCQKACDDQHDRDHDNCKGTPQQKEKCHREANETYAACLKTCPDD